jgi:hypothetical protein
MLRRSKIFIVTGRKYAISSIGAASNREPQVGNVSLVMRHVEAFRQWSGRVGLNTVPAPAFLPGESRYCEISNLTSNASVIVINTMIWHCIWLFSLRNVLPLATEPRKTA